MRKIFLFSIIYSLAGPALAMECLYERFFIAGEFERQNYKAKKKLEIGEGLPLVNSSFMKSWNNGLAVNLGYRFYTLGLRIGYSHSKKIEYDATFYDSISEAEMGRGTLSQRSDNLYIDGIYFYKYENKSEFKFLLGAGCLWTQLKDQLTSGSYQGFYFSRSYSPGLRVGIGSQYQINSCLVVDIMLVSQFPGNKTFKYTTAATLGLAYYI